MTRPPGQGQGEPWWARPGGAPQQGRPAYPPPSPPRPQYPPPQQRPAYPPQQPPYQPPYQPPQQQPGWPPQQQYYQQPVQQQPPYAAPPSQPKPARGPMVAGMIVAVVVLGGLALVGGLWFTGVLGSGTVLDVGKAEAGVTQILSDPINGYGANEVSAVRCNGGKDPEVEQGKGFSCDVTINGAKRQVQVVFADDAGTYEVDGPR